MQQPRVGQPLLLLARYTVFRGTCTVRSTARRAIFLLVSAGFLVLLRAAWDLKVTPPSATRHKPSSLPSKLQPDDYHSVQEMRRHFLDVHDLVDVNRLEVLSQLSLSEYDDGAITAILPVTPASLNELRENIDSLLSVPTNSLKEILVVSDPLVISKVERAWTSIRIATHSSVTVTVLPSNPFNSQSLSVLHALPNVFTSRVLLLATTALRDIDYVTRMTFVDAAPFAFPLGLCGFSVHPINFSCVCASRKMAPVAYLVPPLLSPTSLLAQAEHGMLLGVDTWAALGVRIAVVTQTGMGGFVMSSTVSLQHKCAYLMPNVKHKSVRTFVDAFYKLRQNTKGDQTIPPRIGILLANREDLEAFSPTICEMAQRGTILRTMLFSWSHGNSSNHFALDVGCHLHFETIQKNSSTSAMINKLKEWIRVDSRPSAIIYASEVPRQTFSIEISLEESRLRGTTIVRLPRSDLPFCEWMSTLGVSEWKNWEQPRIDLSIITNDRPRSLERLLNSLTAARYYGDSVVLKINLEQTADSTTRHIVRHFRWKSGTLHVQHRIIAAGVLPAVVESWYPHDNHSYGVLLEDDVEVSPMFYAWLKMAILKYRYSSMQSHSPKLFGVSLYQPTNLELRVEGRVPFEPRFIFAEHDFSDSRTPYLSQVPCSWGAVYFPEHFVEFHDYLALRLSESLRNISTAIIPDIRSNRWTRSWKRYFNELVYLRGYVMLYPNYDLSLSTNHVEAGEHTNFNAKGSHNTRKGHYEVPLMPLSGKSHNPKVSLLDLPSDSLPLWEDLPVFDLWGVLTTHAELATRGRERHKLVSGCPPIEELNILRYDARELLCAHDAHPTIIQRDV